MPFQEDGSGESAESVYDEVQHQQFQPFDPESVQPTSTSPALSTDESGDVGDTSGEDGEAGGEPQAQDPEGEHIEFDPRYREAFEGLLYLGHLTSTFEVWGHRFLIKTLTTEEMAEIALIVKPYQGTISQNSVYQAAVVAAGVVTVDGRTLPRPLNQDDSGLTSTRYPYVSKKWSPPLRERLFNEIFRTEQKVREVLAEMEKGSG